MTPVADPAVQYGEIDPDSMEGFGSVGAGMAAKQLLLRHAALHPPELMALRATPRLEDASEAIDLDEVQRVAKPDGDVEGASVRGDAARNPDSWVVTYIFRRESGRSAPGAIAYKQLPVSRQEYDTRRAALLRGERLTAEGHGKPGEAEVSPREQALSDELERMREEMANLQDPEPYDGYADANANDIKAALKDLPEADPQQVAESRALAQRVAEYEKAHKGRDSVVEAAEKRDEALAEAQKAAEQPPPE